MTGEAGRGPTTTDLLGLAVGLAGAAASVTVMYLAMGAVMAVGGSCAEGGPYVIATPCPQGAPAGMVLGIFALLASWAVAARYGPRVGGVWSAAAVLVWAALFVALGWNFLDAGFSAEGGLDPVGLLLGAMFWAMGIVPLAGALLLMPAGRASSSKNAVTAARRALMGGVTADGTPNRLADLREDPGFTPTTASSDGQAVRQRLLDAIATDLDAVPDRGAVSAAAGPSEPVAHAGGDTEALVAHLERLAELRSKGLLDASEYEAAKGAIVAALEGHR